MASRREALQVTLACVDTPVKADEQVHKKQFNHDTVVELETIHDEQNQAVNILL